MGDVGAVAAEDAVVALHALEDVVAAVAVELVVAAPAPDEVVAVVAVELVVAAGAFEDLAVVVDARRPGRLVAEEGLPRAAADGRVDRHLAPLLGGLEFGADA